MIQQTSMEAYNNIQDDLGSRQLQVLNAIHELGECTNTMISRHLKLPINCITGRTKELRDKKLVGVACVDICPITEKRAIFWKIVQRKLNILPSQSITKCSHCNIIFNSTEATQLDTGDFICQDCKFKVN